MSEKEVWEIDFDQVTLNDLIILEEGAAAFTRGEVGASRKVRDLLGRIVKNKTTKDIGDLPLGELWECLDLVGEGIKSAVPKANDTPS